MNRYSTADAAIRAAEAILTRAESEGRDLTPAEDAAWDDALAQSRKLRLAEETRAAHSATIGSNDREQREALRALVRGEIESATFELRALSTSVNSVPVTFADFIVEAMTTVNPVFAVASNAGAVITTSSGEGLRIPKVTADPASAWIAEAGTASVTDPTISSTVMNAYKLTVLARVSDELLADNAIAGGLESLLGRAAGRSIGLAAGSAFTLGTGTVQPTGFMTAISASSTASGTPFFAADDLVTALYTLPVEYRADAVWMTSNSGLQKLAKLRDANGNPLWFPSTVAGQPSTLLGRPVYENPVMASVGSATMPIAVYSPSSFYIRQVGGLEVSRSNDVYFTSGEVAFKYSWRIDSAMPISTAGVRLVCGNS